MYVCQWHLDIICGKQADALAVMRAWGADEFAGSDFEAALAGMAPPPFRRHSNALARLIVPASQHWVVDRVLDGRPR